MAPPNTSDVHVDALLTNVSIAYMNEQSAYIADRIFPLVPVAKRSDKYAAFDINTFYRARARKREPGTESAGGGYDTDLTNLYYCDMWAYHHDIADEVRSNTDPVFDLEEESTMFVTHSLLLTREKEWVDNYFVTGKWTNERAGVSGVPGGTNFQQWNEAGSTPIQDVRSAITTVQGATGYKPNVMVITPAVLQHLEDHPDIVDRIKHTSRESITEMTLARLFRVDSILLANSVLDSADEGASASIGFTAGKNALLAYVPSRPGIRTPSAGYTFAWRLPETGGSLTVAVRRFRMESIKSDRIEGYMAFNMKQVSADLGAFFLNAVA